MFQNLDFIFIMELIGTVAFSCSGAMIAIKKDLDLLGIIILGVTTACGGGMIRDILIGVFPPALFVHPVYVLVAIGAAFVMFLLIRLHPETLRFLSSGTYENILNLMDALGLGIFTVVGINTCNSRGFSEYLFLKLFLGAITGVGGGILRDLMANQTPAVLRKHIYACASIAGAVSYVTIDSLIGTNTAMLISIFLVVIIRILAKHYEWNLPKATP